MVRPYKALNLAHKKMLKVALLMKKMHIKTPIAVFILIY